MKTTTFFEISFKRSQTSEREKTARVFATVVAARRFVKHLKAQGLAEVWIHRRTPIIGA